MTDYDKYNALFANKRPAAVSTTDWNGMRVLAMDPKSGHILVNQGGDAPHDPASLTKMMTFYLTLQALRDKKLDPEKVKLTLSKAAVTTDYTDLRGKQGKTFTLASMMHAMMTGSDNGATQAIAEWLGSDAIAQMNATARRLHAADARWRDVPNAQEPAASRFANPHGLPAGGRNQTTAYEMAKLLQQLNSEFPHAVQRYMTAPQVKYAGHTEPAHHHLNRPGSPLRLPAGQQAAAKTGFTNAASHNIASLVTGPDGRQLIVVVLGADRQFRDAEAEAGLPKGMQGKGQKGSRVRDALVVKVSQTLFAQGRGRTQEVQVAGAAAGIEVAEALVVPAPALQSNNKESPNVSTVSGNAAGNKTREEVPEHPLRAAAVAAISAKLPAHDRKAVEACRSNLVGKVRLAAPDNAPEVKVPQESPAIEKMEAALAKAKTGRKTNKERIKTLESELAQARGLVATLESTVENPRKVAYTDAQYEAQIERAKLYADAFVESWKGVLPPGGKEALKQRFHTIIEGTAGMESGWEPKIVKGDANRDRYSGVFQIGWDYISDARRELDSKPALKAIANGNKQEKALFDLSKKSLLGDKGLPTTSFAGQGAVMGVMVAASYERFLENGGKPENFDGGVMYFDHLLGASGAIRFRNQLEKNPNTTKKKPDKKKPAWLDDNAYTNNFLLTTHPLSPLNDLNPNRITYAQATARDVDAMQDDKFIHARNRLVRDGASPEHIAKFEEAYLPQWTGQPQKKADDIARVLFQKEMGLQMRTVVTLDGKGACDVLKPMPTMPPTFRTAALDLPPAVPKAR